MQNPDSDAGQPVSVYTVNYPLQYFAASIGGEFVTASYLGPKASDPPFWMAGTKYVRK